MKLGCRLSWMSGEKNSRNPGCGRLHLAGEIGPFEIVICQTLIVSSLRRCVPCVFFSGSISEAVRTWRRRRRTWRRLGLFSLNCIRILRLWARSANDELVFSNTFWLRRDFNNPVRWRRKVWRSFWRDRVIPPEYYVRVNYYLIWKKFYFGFWTERPTLLKDSPLRPSLKHKFQLICSELFSFGPIESSTIP